MSQESGLAVLRKPFPEHQISKLPKETKKQIDERKSNPQSAMHCKICGTWHHKNAVHLDYVGHAAITDRMLDADPSWSWEPLAFGGDGLPVLDDTGGLWIRLTVCGVSRLGYGHAAEGYGRSPGDRLKEVIGDALRNAAMRFGAAVDLWHKGDLHADAEETEQKELPVYPAHNFYENLPKWREAIESGRSDAERIISMVETKGRLSDEQKAQIRGEEA